MAGFDFTKFMGMLGSRPESASAPLPPPQDLRQAHRDFSNLARSRNPKMSEGAADLIAADHLLRVVRAVQARNRRRAPAQPGSVPEIVRQ